MGAESGPTLHSMAADYIKHAYNKPGNVYVGIVSRLDAMTSGVVVLARTSKAASRLAPQFSPDASPESKAQKIYLAVVEGQLGDEDGVLQDHVIKDDAAHRMRVVSAEIPAARNAQLRYHVIARSDEHSMVAVRLGTGRKHQIRLQFANRRHPVIGDRKYGSRQAFPNGIALHSFRLQVNHPTRNEPMSWSVEPPSSWKSLLRQLAISGRLSDRIKRIDWQINDRGAEPEQ